MRIPIISAIGKNSLAIYILQEYCFHAYFSVANSVPPPKNQQILSLVLAPILAVFLTMAAHIASKWLCQYPIVGRLLFGNLSRELPRELERPSGLALLES
jgi:fucose 4-O-acetylase-like acetyltransferase